MTSSPTTGSEGGAHSWAVSGRPSDLTPCTTHAKCYTFGRSPACEIWQMSSADYIEC